MLIVIGLGNPGRRYRETRHNVGHDVVARLAAAWGVRLVEDGFARTARAGAGSRSMWLAVPDTYMNESGAAVRDLLRRRRRRAADLLVIHDDMDLPLGRLRLRPGGGPGGHNGVRSIIETLGTGMFPRLRIGVGRPPQGIDPADFVLQPFSPAERVVIEDAVAQAADAVRFAVTDGLEAAMNRYNRRPAPSAQPS